MLNTQVRIGMQLICIDNKGIEDLVFKNQTYTVELVMHKGTLIRVQGIPVVFATYRFVLADAAPAPMELAVASH